MARKKRKKSGSTLQSPREAFDFTSPRLRRLPLGDLFAVQDLRTYHPERDHRKRLTVLGVPSKVRIAAVESVRHPQPKSKINKRAANWPPALPSAIEFQAPKRVLVCVRRKARREVLHALGGAGGRVKRPRRNRDSNVICRRK